MKGLFAWPRSRPKAPFGAAVTTGDLADVELSLALTRHCEIIAPEYEMKWRELAPSEGAYRWDASDRLVEWAREAGIACRGHTLWWHGSTPDWLTHVSPAVFAAAALAHLEAVMTRYAGRLHSWDVVNEPLAEGDDVFAGLRDTPFSRAFGAGLMREAFRRAAEIDRAGTPLVLNEMGLEYKGPEAGAKRRAMLRLLERERAAGTPIHCLGLQAHLDAADRPIAHKPLRDFLREVAALGVRLMVTELDVSDARCARDLRVRDAEVAAAYREFLDMVLDECEPVAVMTWGLSDKRTWLAEARPRADGAAVRPLPLDRDCRPKAAFRAVTRALRSKGRFRDSSP